MQTKQNSPLYILLFVGIISALGPFVTDFYLPAFPILETYFVTSPSLIQLTLTVSMIGLAAGQLFIGPLSDSYGRRIPLLCSLTVFILSTAGCLFTTTITQFLFLRFIQGLAGAGGVVISKSIATDLYAGKQLARFFSMLNSVTGLAPICAPVLGGILLTFTDWRGIFGILLLVGILLLLVAFGFRESIHATSRSSTTFKNYIPILCNRKFMRYVLIQAMAMGVMFTYIAASPFIFQNHYGLSTVGYGLCFGLNALCIMFGSLIVVRFGSVDRALRFGATGFFIMAVIVALTLMVNLSIIYVELALLLLLVCLGMILPTSTTLSLECVLENSGSASAVLGFMTFFVGGICSPLAGLGNMLISTSIIIVICATSTLLLTGIKKR